MENTEKTELILKHANYRYMFMPEEELRETLKTWSRHQLISWLKWNDRNGIYGDEESLAELGNIMSYEEGVEIMIDQIYQKNA